jgi:hypothetical protein
VREQRYDSGGLSLTRSISLVPVIQGQRYFVLKIRSWLEYDALETSFSDLEIEKLALFSRKVCSGNGGGKKMQSDG